MRVSYYKFTILFYSI